MEGIITASVERKPRMRPARRYEIYLPMTYNDGRLIEDEKFIQTEAELLERFEGVTLMQRRSETALKGLWRHAGEVYSDEITIALIYAYETEEADEWLTLYKETLKDRFQQLEVLIVAFPVEVI